MSCTYENESTTQDNQSEYMHYLNLVMKEDIHYSDLEWNQNNEPHTVISFCSYTRPEWNFVHACLSVLRYTVPRFDVHCSLFSCHGFEIEYILETFQTKPCVL